MIDQAGILMAQGQSVACERIHGVNDNMSKSHYHDYFELYYLEAGERDHMVDDRLYRLKPGELILFPPYVMHHSYGEKDVEFKRLLVYFQKEAVASPGLLAALLKGGGVYKPEGMEKQGIHRLLEALIREQENPSAFSSEYQMSLANLLILMIVRQKKTVAALEAKNRIGKVIQYIHTNYQSDLSLDQLAQLFFISPYYLCREFKRHTNTTIIQYINTTRIMNAQRQFMETDKNITAVSKETGFSNVTHFNRVFKSVTGITPTEYRKHYQKRLK